MRREKKKKGVKGQDSGGRVRRKDKDLKTGLNRMVTKMSEEQEEKELFKKNGNGGRVMRN